MTIASVARLKYPMATVCHRRLSSYASYGLTLFTKQVNQYLNLPILSQLIRYGRRRLKTSSHNGFYGGTIHPVPRRYPPIAAIMIIEGKRRTRCSTFKEIYYV